MSVNVPTPITDMITEMLKNCIPKEMIIIAVRSMELALSTRQPVDEVAEKRRAWDREYRRKRRGHPPDPPDIHPNPPDVGVNALSFLEEDKKHSEEVRKKEKKERGTKLPPDWIAKPSHYAEGLSRGLGRQRVDELADNMRNWCAANANRSITTKADWDATFMGFIRREPSNGNRTGNPRATGHDAILAVAARKARELDRNDDLAGATDTFGFAFGDGTDAARPRGNPGSTEPDRGNHQRVEPDDQRIREGEIIPPDKDAAGIPGRRQFV